MRASAAWIATASWNSGATPSSCALKAQSHYLLGQVSFSSGSSPIIFRLVPLTSGSRQADTRALMCEQKKATVVAHVAFPVQVVFSQDFL